MSTLVGFGERLKYSFEIDNKIYDRNSKFIYLYLLLKCLSILFTADTYVRDVLAYSFFDELFE